MVLDPGPCYHLVCDAVALAYLCVIPEAARVAAGDFDGASFIHELVRDTKNMNLDGAKVTDGKRLPAGGAWLRGYLLHTYSTSITT